MGINWKYIIKVVGYVLILESCFLFLSAAVANYFQGTDVNSFLYSGGITLVTGCSFVIPQGLKKRIQMIGKRESYISVSLSWIVFAFFGALPFYFSSAASGFTDAFFESMSGITTTGTTVLDNLEQMPHGIVFWRSLLQWLGGTGIIVFSLALLPLLGGGAAQLLDTESPTFAHDKFRPRVTQIAKRFLGIYLLLTILLIVLLGMGPMGWYDAVCHGFTTISTGGFSTKTQSISCWDSVYVESVITVFMIVGAINFSLLYFLVMKGNFKKFFKDEELRWFLAVIAAASLVVGAGLFCEKEYDLFHSTRNSIFQVVSVITTTGFSTGNFSVWGHSYLIVFLLLMIVCGCAGSTSGGLKMVRAVVLVKNILYEFERLIHPRAIIPVRLNGLALSFSDVQRLLAFAFLYLIVVVVSWGVLTLTGIPFTDALGAAVSSMGNVGPGFGKLYDSFSGIPAVAKWYISFLMVVGRLEIFTVLILFTPGFWKR
jgi:trk system potassium uptake protein TrkH